MDDTTPRPNSREHRWDEAAGLPLDVVAYAAPQENLGTANGLSGIVSPAPRITPTVRSRSARMIPDAEAHRQGRGAVEAPAAGPDVYRSKDGYWIASLGLSRMRLAANQWVPGYCMLVCTKHVVEPHQLPKQEQVSPRDYQGAAPVELESERPVTDQAEPSSFSAYATAHPRGIVRLSVRGGRMAGPPYGLWIARQMRSEVRGMSRWVMPRGARASRTALTMAGGAPTQPVSPTPFAPSGLSGEGVSVRFSS
jgi:hypothetical protein